ncbi:monovalent cation:proton antiporter-2 (CPA2) family protein [Pseudomonas sp. JS3066]|jgi:glutathione-regulated potassium-efflux system protein KefB|uniref:monovalent cation:proton antiporter-2 (CPA2) family protein n=1 Tax=unclassified Pseudomonas TaxID=196821 RepID=UPI000EA953B2|nr:MULTISPECIES: monovalent cation:proton antiporter-2 (CPA2) family protein [unclassified Pseudomonas]AYF90624.1 glutathione-regulated potassium-efflux system protein KefB [Pseudomonas sp. DY-1]MDH4653378.1 glutathione-regulated potassium-efflux system protein KefB [Pseudomonas sp. BN606]MRK21151.1 glutathione-regulated potassium-efflux system protein KefB [Pseudomonas sp. JG-B]WVK91789.1 monovalent cation:proton antiporter-2 (CPA2) family protein [Pseudomonas sp. JS3066]
MPHDGSLLQAAVVFLFAAVITVPLAKRLQLGAVLGYLLAGVLIGPSVLKLVSDPESVAHVSELGVVLLLFIIGLELSPRRLWVMRRSVFGAGLAQVLLTALAIGLVAWLVFAKSLNTAAVLGFGLALSSTAFGLQILAERKELTSPHGRLAFAILLFQDIAAIPLIALLPLLSGSGHLDTEGVNLRDVLLAVASIGAVIIGGRYLLRPVFRTVLKAGLKEVSTATSLLVVIGTAWLMELAGVSMALGAFIAGLLLADSEYRHELEAQIEPFKGLLLGLFFMSVGMSADLSLLLNEPFAVMVLTILLLMLKLPLLYLVGRFAGGLERGHALRLGIVLAAGGEFAFVVFKVAFEQGMLDARLHGLLVLSITLSMALTPLLVLALFRRLVAAPAPVEVPAEYQRIDSDAPRVVVAGMGRMGQIIARVLHAQQVPFVALDTAVDMIEYGRSLGRMPIYYGDPLRAEILRAAKVDKAEFLIIATDDPDTNLKITELVKRLYPHVKVIARARNRQHVHRLLDLGAVPVRETFHSALEMSRQALLGLGLDEDRANARIRRFQRHDEEVLAAQHNVYDDAAAVIQTAREARTELEHLFDADVIEDKAVK